MAYRALSQAFVTCLLKVNQVMLFTQETTATSECC